jgi:hypothetical protein
MNHVRDKLLFFPSKSVERADHDNGSIPTMSGVIGLDSRSPHTRRGNS